MADETPATAVAAEPQTLKSSQLDFTLATEEYEAFVRECADLSLSIDVPNRHIQHAAVLTKNILRLSKEKVQILTGTFPELFFKLIQDDFQRALLRGVSVQVLVVDGELECEALKKLQSEQRNLVVYKLQDEMQEEVRASVGHFAVSDCKRYRIEDIHERKDFTKDPSVKARASFNNPTGAKNLHEAFQTLLQFATPVN